MKVILMYLANIIVQIYACVEVKGKSDVISQKLSNLDFFETGFFTGMERCQFC